MKVRESAENTGDDASRCSYTFVEDSTDDNLVDDPESHLGDDDRIEAINDLATDLDIADIPELDLSDQEKEQLFRRACALALPKVVLFFIYHGININSTERSSGFNCLHALADNYHTLKKEGDVLETLEILLQKISNVNATDRSGCTFLYYLIKNAKPNKDDVSNAMVLLSNNRQVDFDCVNERTKMTALDFALACRNSVIFIEMLQCNVNKLVNVEGFFQLLHHGVLQEASDSDDDVEIIAKVLPSEEREVAIALLMQKIKNAKLQFYKDLYAKESHVHRLGRIKFQDMKKRGVYLNPDEYNIDKCPNASGAILASSALLAVMLPDATVHQALFGSEAKDNMMDPVLVSLRSTDKNLLEVMASAKVESGPDSATTYAELSPRGSGRVLKEEMKKVQCSTEEDSSSSQLSTGRERSNSLRKSLSRGSLRGRSKSNPPKPTFSNTNLWASHLAMQAKDVLDNIDNVSWGKMVSACLIGGIDTGEFLLVEKASADERCTLVRCKSPKVLTHEDINPLFFRDTMRRYIHPEVREYIARLDAVQIVRHWIEPLFTLGANSEALFFKDGLPQQKAELSPRLSPRFSPRSPRKSRFATRNIDPAVLKRAEVFITIPEQYISMLVNNIIKASEAINVDNAETYMDLVAAIDGDLESVLEQAFNEANTPHERLEYARKITSDTRAKLKNADTKVITLEEAVRQVEVILKQIDDVKRVQGQVCQGVFSGLSGMPLPRLKERALASVFKRLKGQQKIQLELLKYIGKDYFQLTSLDLSYCEAITPTAFETTLKNLENLTHLNMSHCKNVGDWVLPVLEKYGANLRTINLSYTDITERPNIKFTKTKRVNFSGCKKLKNVDISPQRHVSGVKSLMRSSESVLTEVTISDCNTLDFLTINSDSLRVLIANNCERLREVVVNRGEKTKSLTTLEVDFCSALRVLKVNAENLIVFKALKVEMIRHLHPRIIEILVELIQATKENASASAERAGSAMSLLLYRNAQFLLAAAIEKEDPHLWDGTRLFHPNFTGALLLGLGLQKVYWSEACFAMTNFNGANLEGARLPYARFNQRAAVRHGAAVAQLTKQKEQRGFSEKLCFIASNEKVKLLATASDDRHVILWQLDTLEPYRVLEQVEKINGLSMSSDGTLLAVSCQDGKVYIWNLTTNNCIKKMDFTLAGINSHAFSKSGASIVVTSTSSKNTVGNVLLGRIEPLNANAKPIDLMQYKPTFCSCAHPVKEVFATAEDLNVIALYEAKAARLILKLSDVEAKGQHMLTMAFTPNGNYLFAASTDKFLRIYHLMAHDNGFKTSLKKTTAQQQQPITFMKIVADPKNPMGYLIFTVQNDPKSSHSKVVIFSVIPEALSPEIQSLTSWEFASFDTPIVSLALSPATNELIIALGEGQLIALKLPESLHEMPRHRSLQLSCKGLSLFGCEMPEESRALAISLGAENGQSTPEKASGESGSVSRKLVRLSALFSEATRRQSLSDCSEEMDWLETAPASAHPSSPREPKK